MTLPLKISVSWTLRCVTGAIVSYVPKGRDAFAFRVSSSRRNKVLRTVWPFCQKFKPHTLFTVTVCTVTWNFYSQFNSALTVFSYVILGMKYVTKQIYKACPWFLFLFQT